MKRLKWRCLFYGRYGVLLWMALPAFALGWGIMIAAGITEISKVLIACGIAYLLLIMIAVCIIRKPGREERELIADARPLKWKPITKSLRQQIRRKENPFGFTLILTLSVSAFVIVLTILSNGWTVTVQVLSAIMAGGSLLGSLAAYLNWHFWQKIDSGAEFAVVMVHHSYTTVHQGRGSKIVERYLVFYQPDGKYVVQYDGTGDPPDRFVLVRFHGKIRICFDLI